MTVIIITITTTVCSNHGYNHNGAAKRKIRTKLAIDSNHESTRIPQFNLAKWSTNSESDGWWLNILLLKILQIPHSQKFDVTKYLGHLQEIQFWSVIFEHWSSMFLPRSSWSIAPAPHQDGRLRSTAHWRYALRTERRTWRGLCAHLGNHRHGPTRRRWHPGQTSTTGRSRGFFGKTVMKWKLVWESGCQCGRNPIDNCAVEGSLWAVKEATRRRSRTRRWRLRWCRSFTGKGVSSQTRRQLRQVLLLLLLRRRTRWSQYSMMKRFRSWFRSNWSPHAGAPKCRSPFGYGATGVWRQTCSFMICAGCCGQAVPVTFLRRQVWACQCRPWLTTEDTADSLTVLVAVITRSVSTRSPPRRLTSSCTAAILTRCYNINQWTEW